MRQSFLSEIENFLDAYSLTDTSKYRMYYDKDDKIVIQFLVPGWNRENLKVEETSEYIIVSGERPKNDNIKSILRDSVYFNDDMKFTTHKFQKRNYTVETVSLENGLLTLQLKTKESSEQKKLLEIK